MTPRRYLLVGLGAIYLVAAVFAIRWQLREDTWDAAVEPYVAFVEQERGLRFSRPVDVRWADISAELEADFAAERERSPAEDSTEGEDPYLLAYALLGLIDPTSTGTLSETVEDTAVEQAGAFYDPTIEEIVLPIGEDAAGLGFTIVHELTHALQHQNGMLDWTLESPDSASTRTTLIEGDAERIALAWFDQLSSSERERFLSAVGYEEDSVEVDPGNSFFETSFAASYALGLPMVQVIVEVGGQKEIDRLLRADDIGTSERLIDVLSESPTSTVDAFGTVELPPDRDVAHGDIGAVTWFQALAPRVGTEQALDALVGYDDDAFVIIEGVDVTCGRFHLAFDSREDAVSFADTAREVAAGVAGSSVEQVSAAVDWEMCSPMGDPFAQRFGTIMPLVVAHEMTLLHLRNGVEPAVARCAGLGQAGSIPADQPLERFVGWDVVEDTAVDYLDACETAVFSPR